MRKIFGLVLVLAVFAVLLSSRPAAALSGSGTVSVQAVPGQSLFDIVGAKIASSWPWYVVRASGLVAGVSLVILMLSGIGSVTGHTFRFLEPLTAWATHRALGIVMSVSMAIHIVTLLIDKFVPFNVVQILVPWTSQYKPLILFGLNLGSVFVALGILAFYVALAIVVTSLFLVDKTPRVWKFIHLASYFVIAAVFFHALFLGTDLSGGIGRAIWVLLGLFVLGVIIVRLRRVDATK